MVEATPLERLLEEGVELVEALRDVIAESNSAALLAAGTPPELVLADTLRMTALAARLMDGVAWIMGRLAVETGELDREAARVGAWRLPPLRRPMLGDVLPADPLLADLEPQIERYLRRLVRLDALLDFDRPVVRGAAIAPGEATP